ncbi:hypothetical protein TNCV_952871 [Trichonephila clavipes]|nr:hypothetical protein TNCV_952871 [Trichonephila clavipes]
MPSIGVYNPYGLASILTGLESNRECVGYLGRKIAARQPPPTCLPELRKDVEFVKELIQYTIEDRKRAEEDRKRMQIEEDRKKEAENRLREKELELELARLNVNSDNERTGEGVVTRWMRW